MSSRAIEVAIQKLAGVHKTDDLVCMACTVQSVDEGSATCTCMGDNDIIIPNVKLQAGVCDGLLILPVAGSTVIIAMSKYNDPFVFMLSDVDKFYLQVSSASATITNDGKHMYNDGGYGGAIKSIDPDNSNSGLLYRINQIEDLVNNILTTLKASTVPLAPSGTYQFGALFSAYSDISPTTQRADIESDYITHGKPNQ